MGFKVSSYPNHSVILWKPLERDVPAQIPWKLGNKKKNPKPNPEAPKNREEYQSKADGKGEQLSRQVSTVLLDIDEKPTLSTGAECPTLGK